MWIFTNHKKNLINLSHIRESLDTNKNNLKEQIRWD